MHLSTIFPRAAVAALLTGLISSLTAAEAAAARLKDICEVQGARANSLKGIGLVVGLAGTGDKSPAAIRAQQRMLSRFDVEVASTKELKSDNIAVAVVLATFPPFAKEGTRIDVQVNSIYDCENLEGGTLLETLLYGIDNEVYAVAQGPVSVGGFGAAAGGGGGGASARKNHVTAGRIPMGAHVEREIPSTITDGERLMLLIKRPDFATAHNIQQAINTQIEPEIAVALAAGAVNVRIPEEARSELVSFIARLQEITVSTDLPARVVINERTGTIVVGGEVIIKPCQVAHGSLSIEIAITPVVSQPPPFSPGETVRGEVAEVVVTEGLAYLMPVEGTSAGDVAMALNKLKITPLDMIAIFQALREAGALEADLEIM
jgi:flagellar P-ring protein precursor FlgI